MRSRERDKSVPFKSPANLELRPESLGVLEGEHHVNKGHEGVQDEGVPSFTGLLEERVHLEYTT